MDGRMRAGLRARLTSPRAVRGYPGVAFGDLYLIVPLVIGWSSDGSLPAKLALTVIALCIGLGLAVIPPLVWGRSPVRIHLAMLAYAALVCLLFPFTGAYTVWMFIYLACAAAIGFERVGDVVAWIVAIVIAQFFVLLASGELPSNWYAIMLTVSISTMMLGIVRLASANRRLEDAQSEIARLAVIEERSRFSRDLHDVLGHSLTVVTVKSELAARLVELDPERTRAELADIERLSRGALADLRSAVGGYRAMSLDTELSAARAALAAAEIEATVPVSSDVVEPSSRELFAWAVREAVTNVIRHAQAERCVIELRHDSVRVTDDGVGIPALVRVGERGDETDAARGISLGDGTGLAGLGERAAAAGAVLTVEPGDRRGTVVTVSRSGGAEASLG